MKARTCQMSNVCCAMCNVVVKAPDDPLTRRPNPKRKVDLVIMPFCHWVVLQVHRTSHNRHSTFDRDLATFHSFIDRPYSCMIRRAMLLRADAMRIIDSHFHWWPREIFEQLCRRNGYPRAERNNRGGYNYVGHEGRPSLNSWTEWFDLDRQLEHMDGLGHQVSVVCSLGPFSIYFSDLPPEEGRDAAIMWNEKMAGAQRKYPGRVWASAAVPLTDTEIAIEVLDHAIHKLGLMGKNGKNARLPRPPSTYIRHMYTDTVSPHSMGIKFAIEYYDIDRVMYGSDYPCWDPATALALIQEIGLSGADLDKLLYGNAHGILGLADFPKRGIPESAPVSTTG